MDLHSDTSEVHAATRKKPQVRREDAGGVRRGHLRRYARAEERGARGGRRVVLTCRTPGGDDDDESYGDAAAEKVGAHDVQTLCTSQRPA